VLFNTKKYTQIDGIYTADLTNIDTLKVTKFYSHAPFPNYSKKDNRITIKNSGDKNYLAKNFKEFCQSDKKILEAGSGTSQLSNYLAIGTNNQIFAFDATFEALQKGKKFSSENGINNIHFIQGDILEKVFEENFFDIIWCNGVLHHTPDPYLGFQNLVKSLKSKGYILIGLYNRYGRFWTVLRRYISKFIGTKFLMFFDPHLRQIGKNKLENHDRIESWIRDQYKHPIESLHTFDEVLKWFKLNNIEYISSLPTFSLNLDNVKYKIFSKQNSGNFFERFINQILMLFQSYGKEGGVFIVLGRKK